MANYQADVKALLQHIGGKENIRAVSHCMTRMRFVLVDPAKAETDKIEALPSVKGTFTQAGQFQVIIGNDVADFYNQFTAFAGIEGVSKDAVKAAAASNQSLAQRIVGTLGEIFAPIIPALICGGLILGFRNIIGEINFFANGTQSLADISQFWSGVYKISCGSLVKLCSTCCRWASSGPSPRRWAPPRFLASCWALRWYRLSC